MIKDFQKGNPYLLDCDGEFTERDLSMVNLYDDYMNGKIK